MIGINILIFWLLIVQVGLVAASPPVTPTNFAAAPMVGRKASTLTLTWSATGTITSFTAERADRADFTSETTSYTVTGTERFLALTGLARNSTYYFRIRANNPDGSSAWSPILKVKTP